MPEEPPHFSDYGFDPQFDYFQILEEARKQKRENPSRSINSTHFKLQKPISKDHTSHHNTRSFKKFYGRKKWWKNALLFLRGKWAPTANNKNRPSAYESIVYPVRAAFSGPVYITESRSGPSTPCRTTSRPSSGPLAATAMKGNGHSVYKP